MRATRYWKDRIARHVVLAGCALATGALFYFLTPPPDVRHRLSMGSAYAALLFFGVSLAVGPWNLLRENFNPVSFDLRRDIGIWAGLLGVFHTVVGLTVHLRGRMWMYFFKQIHPLRIQNSNFGLANFTGIVATFILLLLLAISNDVSLRRLGRGTWKNLQRTTYGAFVLTAVHGVAYQMIEKRQITFRLVLVAVVVGIVILQMAAFRYRRRAAVIST